MFEWLKKKLPFVGTVLFRGSLPPKADDFKHLERPGISIRPAAASGDAHWALQLRHPQWGEASLVCRRNQAELRPPRLAVECSFGLTPEEKESILLGESVLMLVMDSKGENVLRERKLALRFLRAVMGTDGLAACDYVGERFWSRDALEEELAHDAVLDIEQIYTLHGVTSNDQPIWLHSHGLEKVGAFDFDIVRPTEDVCNRGRDGLRALAFAILQGNVSMSTPRFELGHPKVFVRFVKADDFQRLAPPEDAKLRNPEGHDGRRAVICEPAGGLLGRFSRRVKPSRFFSQNLPDEGMFAFSTEATELMARRARDTYPLLRQIAGELAEFEFPTLVKIGYQVDGGGPNDREHLWFTVDACHDDSIEATLVNQPFSIARMKQGDRGRHPLELMSDWTILTPAGPISPRFLHPLRMIRGHTDEIREAMRSGAED